MIDRSIEGKPSTTIIEMGTHKLVFNKDLDEVRRLALRKGMVSDLKLMRGKRLGLRILELDSTR